MSGIQTLDLRTQPLEEWAKLQYRQASQAVFEDQSLSFSSDSKSNEGQEADDDGSILSPYLGHINKEECVFKNLEYVAGLDVSYFVRDGIEMGVAVLSLLSFPQLQLLRSFCKTVDLSSTPYMPSYLSFREAPVMASLLNDLNEANLPFPQVLFVDGNGRLHEREAGSAVAVGLLSGLPTIGVAKEYHPIAGEDLPSSPSLLRKFSEQSDDEYLETQKAMQAKCRQILKRRGDWIGIRPTLSSTFHGAAMLSSPISEGRKPIFVSCGHRISLRTALKVTLACCKTARVPEPIRQADREGTVWKKPLRSSHAFFA